jgi:predicted ATPase
VVLPAPRVLRLDEPEAAHSFSSTLVLVSHLHELARTAGAQVLCATHSPVLAALPGATILEVGEWGIRPTSSDDLVLVASWRAYLEDPRRYLRHVLDG